MSLKQARLYPSHAVPWIAVGSLLVLLPVSVELLRWLSINVFGIIGADHLIYVLLIGFLLAYTFYLAQKVGQLTNRVERIIVALAILESASRAGQIQAPDAPDNHATEPEDEPPLATVADGKPAWPRP